jgi:hypothetical protein
MLLYLIEQGGAEPWSPNARSTLGRYAAPMPGPGVEKLG